MTTATEEKLHELLEDFSVAMLVTRSDCGQLRSRPMALAEIEPDGTMWFLTERDSGKIDEIACDHHVNVAMQSKLRFVSISGQAVPVSDRVKIAEIWKDSFQPWFPGGKDDPNLMLLRVDGEAGEYWDNSGTSGIKYLIEAGKAFLTGTQPNVEHDPAIHGKVAM